MKTYDATTIAASRSRISAGIEAFDRIISAKPVAFDLDCDTPESLLDALSRSAIATALSAARPIMLMLPTSLIPDGRPASIRRPTMLLDRASG